MRLNRATDYGFRMVLYMSILPEGTRITGAELAKALNIPDRFLLKIMRNLTRDGLVKSFRGVDGGFSLAKKPKDITILNVVEAIEGNEHLQKCLYDMESCSRGCNGVCAVRESLSNINEVLIKEMDSVDFEKLATREKELREVII